MCSRERAKITSITSYVMTLDRTVKTNKKYYAASKTIKEVCQSCKHNTHKITGNLEASQNSRILIASKRSKMTPKYHRLPLSMKNCISYATCFIVF